MPEDITLYYGDIIEKPQENHLLAPRCVTYSV